MSCYPASLTDVEDSYAEKVFQLCLQVRTAIVGMLDAWISAVPLEKVLPAVADAIAAPKASSEGKLTGLKWLSTVLDNGRASKGLAHALRAATLGMNDKASDVREAGTAVMNLVLEASLHTLFTQAHFAVQPFSHTHLDSEHGVFGSRLSLTSSRHCMQNSTRQHGQDTLCVDCLQPCHISLIVWNAHS